MDSWMQSPTPDYYLVFGSKAQCGNLLWRGDILQEILTRQVAWNSSNKTRISWLASRLLDIVMFMETYTKELSIAHKEGKNQYSIFLVSLAAWGSEADSKRFHTIIVNIRQAVYDSKFYTFVGSRLHWQPRHTASWWSSKCVNRWSNRNVLKMVCVCYTSVYSYIVLRTLLSVRSDINQHWETRRSQDEWLGRMPFRQHQPLDTIGRLIDLFIKLWKGLRPLWVVLKSCYYLRILSLHVHLLKYWIESKSPHAQNE